MTVRVLVADDQAPFRLAARGVLRAAADFELVGVATSGEQAVTLATALRPDLVLMDIRMAGIGGIEAARRITAALPQAITILVSTYPAKDLPSDAGSCGAAAYLHKSDFATAALIELYTSRSAR